MNLEQLKLDPTKEDFERVMNSGGRFWLLYMELCELMLNLIYASRTGSWELHLACIEEMIPRAFAYDR